MARAKARASLADDLKSCWSSCFDEATGDVGRWRRAEPHDFFCPFSSYCVTMYESLAGVLLEHRPSIWVYENWLNFAAKTQVCEGEAITSPLPNGSGGVDSERLPNVRQPDVRCALWEEMMNHSWRIFYHYDKSALESHAHKLIGALENPAGKQQSALLGFVHSAISQRTLHLLARGVEVLGQAGKTLATFATASQATKNRDSENTSLPELPHGYMEAGWKELLVTHELTPEDVEDLAIKREHTLQASVELKRSPRGVSGSWRIGHIEANGIGVASTSAIADARFRDLAVQYWRRLPCDSAEQLFPEWLAKLKEKVVAETGSCWADSELRSQWYEEHCKPKIRNLLSSLEQRSKTWLRISEKSKLEQALDTFGLLPSKSSFVKPPYWDDPNPCYYFDRTEIDGLNVESRNAIVAGLLEVQSACLEGLYQERLGSGPIKAAYDHVARALENSGLLNFHQIEFGIPRLVFDALACGMWRSPIYTQYASSDRAPLKFGHEWTNQSSVDILNTLIGGRVNFWRAQLVRTSEVANSSCTVLATGGQVSNEDLGTLVTETVGASTTTEVEPTLGTPDSRAFKEAVVKDSAFPAGVSHVAVCLQPRRGASSSPPKLFASEPEAKEWQRRIAVRQIPNCLGQQPLPFNYELADSCDLRYDGDLTFEEHGWNIIVPVRHLRAPAEEADFTGSIEGFLDLTLRKSPDLPTVEEQIDAVVNDRLLQFACVLGRDWNFDRIAINPSSWFGFFNLASRDAIVGVVFRFVLALEHSMSQALPHKPATSVADFWQSWQTWKHIGDFCRELGQFGRAQHQWGSHENPEAEAERAYNLSLQQITAFAQTCVLSGFTFPHPALKPNLQDSQAAQLQEVGRPRSIKVLVRSASQSVLFATETGRGRALDEYQRNWKCSQADLARKAKVDPADLSKWKKGTLTPTSEKSARVEMTLIRNEAPTPVSKRLPD